MDAIGFDFVLRLVDIGRHVGFDVGTVGNLVILRRQIDSATTEGCIKGVVRFISVIGEYACPAIGANWSGMG